MFQIGQLVSFSYPAVHEQGTRAHDKRPKILVLHPGWRKGSKLLVHGLNFNYLTDDEINLIRMLIDPGFQLKYFDNLQKKNPALAQEFDRIIGRAGAAVITSPHDFYLKVIKPFIQVRGWDPYRLYDPAKITGSRVVQSTRKMVGEQRLYSFGTNPMRDHGRNEKDIVADLAQRKAEEEKGGPKLLTPQEERFIKRLHGSALAVFQNYKNKFQHMKGPSMDLSMPSFGHKTKF